VSIFFRSLSRALPRMAGVTVAFEAALGWLLPGLLWEWWRSRLPAGTLPPPPPGERVEMDSEQAEEVGDLEPLLLPDGRIPCDVRQFALHVSHATLGGWVKQRSPACAAASTAGAWNSVMGLRRNSDGAQSQDTVLEILRGILQSKIDERHARLERLWAGAPVAPLEDAVRGELAAQGLTLGGESKTVKGATKKQVWDAVLAVCQATDSADPVPDGGEPRFRHQDGCFAALRAAWDTERSRRGSETPDSGPVVTIRRKPKPVKEEEPEDDEEEEDAPSEASSADPIPQSARKEVVDFFHFVAGMDKLTRPLPTTAIFGNWGIIQATRLLRDGHPDSNVTVKLFMGRKATGSVPEVCLSAKDSEEETAEQWHRLCRELRKPQTALIFHLTNHYALLFALREWTTLDGVVVRQILTTRKGQRPTVWMDWSEARDIMIRALGYKLMSVHRAS